MNKFFSTIWAACALAFLFSCGSDPSGQSKPKTHLPQARGEANVILVVMDTALWKGPVGDTLKSIFAADVPGLPQPEPYFKIRNINPYELNNVLKAAKNMIFVTTLSSKTSQGQKMREYFTDESLEKIKSDSSKYMLIQKNVFANGQDLMHLFGQNPAQLLDNIQNNRDRLRQYFVELENKRMSKELFKVREKGIEKSLKEDHGFLIKVPYGFDLAKNLKDFVWLRLLDAEYEKDIFVHYRPYTSQDPFEDMLAFREQITPMYLRDSEKPQIFMTLQDDEYQEVEEVNFKGKYAKEARGLWRYNDDFAGGPYLGYLFVDESQKRLYYIEGYVYYPGGDKRVFMQEMEIILNTFVAGKDLKP